MKETEVFNNIFDECLGRLLGGESIEECLSSYPEYASELEPLLRTTIAVSKATEIKPRPVFRAKAREELHTTFRVMEERRGFSFFGLRSMWATAAAVFMAVLLLGSGGTALASGNSMPDSALYPVKLAVEQVQVTLTPSTLGKAELYAKFAGRRVEEMIYAASINDPQTVELVAQRLDNNLVKVANLAGIPFSGEEALLAPVSIPAPKMMFVPSESEVQSPPAAPQMMMTAPESTEAAPAEVQKTPEYHLDQEERTQITAAVPGMPGTDDEVTTAFETIQPSLEPSGRGTEDIIIEPVWEELSPEEKREIKIIEVLANQTLNNSQRLRGILESVPDSVKPILIRAINETEALRDKALRNIKENNVKNIDTDVKVPDSNEPNEKTGVNNAGGG